MVRCVLSQKLPIFVNLNLRNLQNRNDILKFLSENKPYLVLHFDIEKIGVFGSFARNEYNEASDIDILVVFRPGTSNLFDKRLELKDFIEKKFNREVDICHEKAIKPVFREMILRDVIYA